MTAMGNVASKTSKNAPRKHGSLARYRSKRDFSSTPEPSGGGRSKVGSRQFVIQKHWATRLHYDFRLELNGTMKSWAVPKGPSFDPKVRRMAIHVEDHPISYNKFEGDIPARQYGAGKVIIWDKGAWSPIGDPDQGYRKGNLKFTMNGLKLHGAWVLVRIKSRESKQDAWLLIKERDEYAQSETNFSVTDEMPHSVAASSPPGPSANRKSTRQPQTAAARPPVGKARARSRMPAGATRASPPAEIKPVLATLVDRPPADSEGWLFEVKFDGYRLLARIDGDGTPRLITRNGNDWTHRLPHLEKAIASMSLKPGWLDGEIVMLGDNGATSFQRLQNAFDSERTSDINYFVFDLPYYDGYDLTHVKLEHRRSLLQPLLQNTPDCIRFSEAFEAPPSSLIASACKLGLEGIIGKRRDSLYTFRRSPDWIKLK